MNDPQLVAESQWREHAAHMVLEEAQRSRETWPAYHSAHECYGVLAEELAEFAEAMREVRRPEDHATCGEALRKELMQIAAVAIRGMVEL